MGLRNILFAAASAAALNACALRNQDLQLEAGYLHAELERTVTVPELGVNKITRGITGSGRYISLTYSNQIGPVDAEIDGTWQNFRTTNQYQTRLGERYITANAGEVALRIKVPLRKKQISLQSAAGVVARANPDGWIARDSTGRPTSVGYGSPFTYETFQEISLFTHPLPGLNLSVAYELAQSADEREKHSTHSNHILLGAEYDGSENEEPIAVGLRAGREGHQAFSGPAHKTLTGYFSLGPFPVPVPFAGEQTHLPLGVSLRGDYRSQDGTTGELNGKGLEPGHFIVGLGIFTKIF